VPHVGVAVVGNGMWLLGKFAEAVANEAVLWQRWHDGLVAMGRAPLPTAFQLLWHWAHVPGITLACARWAPWKVFVVWQVSQGWGAGM